MMERPILFNGEMVRATLDGRKTQTRRLDGLDVVNGDPDAYIFCGWVTLGTGTPEAALHAVFSKRGSDDTILVKCPYGQIGDRLWVRETWKIGAWRNDIRIAIDYQASPEVCQTPWKMVLREGYSGIDKLIVQSEIDCDRAGIYPDGNGYRYWKPGESPCRWRPSIHMPRWASRITLEITNIRVERVKDITTDDIIAEGAYTGCADCSQHGGCPSGCPMRNFCGYAYSAWEKLWNNINAKRGHSWESNPWVWVIELKEVINDRS